MVNSCRGPESETGWPSQIYMKHICRGRNRGNGSGSRHAAAGAGCCAGRPASPAPLPTHATCHFHCLPCSSALPWWASCPFCLCKLPPPTVPTTLLCYTNANCFNYQEVAHQLTARCDLAGQWFSQEVYHCFSDMLAQKLSPSCRCARFSDRRGHHLR